MSAAIDRLGIEALTMFSLPPLAYVELAADLGCRHISTGLTSLATHNPHGYPAWSLRDDAQLRREMISVMRDRGVAISLGEGYSIRAGIEARDRAVDLALMVELGVRRINAVALDADLARSFDQLAMLAEMAASHGVETTLEFGPGMSIGDLPTALSALRHVGRPDCRLLIDTMHTIRSGAGVADIAALDPSLIGYVQLCDAPRVSRHASYMDEAMSARLPPGAGELPLQELLAVLPAHLVVSLEVPHRAWPLAGEDPRTYVGRCVSAARELLAQTGAR